MPSDLTKVQDIRAGSLPLRGRRDLQSMAACRTDARWPRQCWSCLTKWTALSCSEIAP